jgi:hypothetical protein
VRKIRFFGIVMCLCNRVYKAALTCSSLQAYTVKRDCKAAAQAENVVFFFRGGYCALSFS